MAKKRLLEKYDHRKRDWLHDSRFFIIAVVVLFIVFRFVIGFSVIGGNSMSPALEDHELVLYNRLATDYSPGDIVSMRVPSGDYYVKRVVAVAGDTVELFDGEVYVNGEEINDEWGHGMTEPESIAVIYPYKVREGNVFVLGDNREESMDSRGFGEVNTKQIKGRIVCHMGRWYIRGIDK